MVETMEDEHAVVGPGFGTASTPTPGPSHKARTMYVMYPGVDDLAAKRAYSNTRFGTGPYKDIIRGFGVRLPDRRSDSVAPCKEKHALSSL